MIRLEVAVAAPLEQTLSYLYSSAAPSLFNNDLVGKRVLVPLGGGRRLTGYVLGVLPDEDVPYELKHIIEVLDREPLFHANLIPFFRWIAKYYHFPIGEVIKTALPGGLTSGSGKIITLAHEDIDKFDRWTDESTPGPVWLAELLKRGFLTAAMSRKILGDKVQKKILEKLIKIGYAKISHHFEKDSVKEKLEVCFSLSKDISLFSDITRYNPQICQDIISKLENDLSVSLKNTEKKALCYLIVLTNISDNPLVPQKEWTKSYPGASKVIQSLLQKQLIYRTDTRIFRNPFGGQLAHFPRPESLTDEQEKVLKKVIPAIKNGDFVPFLLFGVTGCGKTEVYLRAAEETLKQGKDVLVLVPEIALATLLESHFISRFTDQVVLLHSGLSVGERFDQWSLAASGQAKIVIGARSAVFAPLINPGLIIVDEEHDAGYKQDDTLRYQGRDLAVLRASIQKSVVLLGSATPSVTSYYHAMTGKYSLLEMTRRVAGRPLPTVTVVDLRKRNKEKSGNIFSQELRSALAENLSRKEQSLLLMNRRGFSSTVICQECGTPVMCIHCHVSLAFHKKSQKLICHYCGYNITHKLICTKCRSTTLIPIGFGTERIEEEVHTLFPEAKVARLDSDTAANRKKFFQILKAMHDQQIDILIGTQMIAKGHHFPNVTLVGVVWADGGLNMPDFRAAERTFQIISQVTGRAGRGIKLGRVIVQTMQPDHYSIVYSRNHQYRELYEHEIKIRRMPLFPPFVRLIAFLISGKSEPDVRKSAIKVATYCREISQAMLTQKELPSKHNPEVLGPAPAPLDRLCDRYRWQVLLKGAWVDELHSVCKSVVDNLKMLNVGDTHISIDVDPENMM
jgi:primosomal protein N' (replication factor Y) (superfamily II helicase)